MAVSGQRTLIHAQAVYAQCSKARLQKCSVFYISDLANVPHRQWVFTIPKRLRVYFRYDRSLLGKLCRAAYDTVCDVFRLEIDGDCCTPAMIGAVQTFGNLVHFPAIQH
jgi:hypothetical protein